MQLICTYEIERSYPLNASEVYSLGLELNSKCLAIFNLLLQAQDKNGSKTAVEKFVRYGFKELKICEIRQNHQLNQTQGLDSIYDENALHEDADLTAIEEDIRRAFRRLDSFYEFLFSQQDRRFSMFDLNNAAQVLRFGMNLRRDLYDLLHFLSSSYREGKIKQALNDLLLLNNDISRSIKQDTISLIDQQQGYKTPTNYPIAANI